ncbi:MAG: hypothetical protein LLG44_05855 [Chloroflexi bacterium]|nr:hypothetical protein [Chloroflexota bacterium]
MANTLAAIIDQVEGELKDTGNAVWSADELTAHIRRALGQVSLSSPRLLDALLPSADGVYEYSLSALTGLLWLVDCWYPWNPAEPCCPAPRPERWGLVKEGTLAIESGTRPDGAVEHQIRVFYCAAHTIAGLDGAASGTLDAAGEGLVVLGASGYAALQRAQDGTARVWPNAGAVAALTAWGEQRLAHFNAALDTLRRRSVLGGDARGEVR